jgi:hypothetical protein
MIENTFVTINDEGVFVFYHLYILSTAVLSILLKPIQPTLQT